ncbi:MAG: nucleotidyltransferase domain-containing protein [bacterium]
MKKHDLSPAEDAALRLFLERIKQDLGASLKKVVLFGSRARGKGHEDSDIDVLVLVDEMSLEKKHLVWDIACDILLDTEIDISPLCMSEAHFTALHDHERLIAKDIDEEGIPL